ncbi:MAG TPA: hypothetical protein VFD59_08840 [Nocardioidaceae bacterium]|nr:hypothetical protein [Nocardioidaceae bacterium]
MGRGQLGLDELARDAVDRCRSDPRSQELYDDIASFVRSELS